MKKYIIILIALFTGGYLVAQNSTKELSDSEKNSLVSGFYNRISGGVLGGSNSSNSFHIVNGLRLGQHWSVGLGLGAERFANAAYVPIFFEGNYRLFKEGPSPFVGALAGYEMPMRSLGENKGGFTAGGRIGFDFFVNRHIGITTSLGYRYGYLRDFDNWGGWDDFVTIRQLNRYEFRVGLIFQ